MLRSVLDAICGVCGGGSQAGAEAVTAGVLLGGGKVARVLDLGADPALDRVADYEWYVWAEGDEEGGDREQEDQVGLFM